MRPLNSPQKSRCIDPTRSSRCCKASPQQSRVQQWGHAAARPCRGLVQSLTPQVAVLTLSTGMKRHSTQCVAPLTEQHVDHGMLHTLGWQQKSLQSCTACTGAQALSAAIWRRSRYMWYFQCRLIPELQFAANDWATLEYFYRGSLTGAKSPGAIRRLRHPDRA